MYLFEHMVAKAVDKAGMRALLGEVLYDFPSSNYGPPEEGLRFTERLIDEYRDHPLIDIAVEPHSTYTCSPDLLQAWSPAGRKMRGAPDYPLVRKQGRGQYHSGTLPGNTGAPSGPPGCLDLEPDRRPLRGPRSFGKSNSWPAGGVRVVTNPESNMKLASGTAPIPELIDAGVTLGLGTDGPALQQQSGPVRRNGRPGQTA